MYYIIYKQFINYKDLIILYYDYKNQVFKKQNNIKY